MSSGVKKGVIAAIIAVAALTGLILGANMGYRAKFGNFYGASENVFTIPDTGSGFIAQDVMTETYLQRHIVTGYMKNGSETPVYLIKPESGEVDRKVFIRLEDNSIYKGQAGGVAASNGFVYVADPDNMRLLVLDRTLLELTSDGKSVPCMGVVDLKETGVRPDNLCLNGSKLYVAEDAGETTKVISLTVSKSGTYGLKVTGETEFYLPAHTRGFAVMDTQVVVSLTDEKGKGRIAVYDPMVLKNPEGNDLETLRKEVPAPASVEGISALTNNVLVLQSGAGRSFLGKVLTLDKCVTLDLQKACAEE